MTIDEQLLPFRGRCKFRQYIPSKPARYGIKTFALVDARSFYTYNLETYVGTQPHPSFTVSNTPHDLVLRLVEPIKKTGRNITADNWFTSMPLIKELAKLDLSYVGTVKKNKREIPPEFQPLKNRQHTSSLFGFHQTEENLNVTMVSYIPEKKKKGKKKAVVLMSTLHDDDAVDPENHTHKPEMILFYNDDKCGVDVVDQMCASYSVQRKTRRWPMVVLSNLLNISAINAYVIFKKNRPGSKISRYQFLQNLSRALILPHLEQRTKLAQLPTASKTRCFELIGQKPPTQTASQLGLSNDSSSVEFGRCNVCLETKLAKESTNSRSQCAKCQKPACRKHMFKMCLKCVQN